MGKLNFQNDLFLGLQELNRRDRFLREGGYIRLFQSLINNFGIVRVDSDVNFDNFKVTNGSANGTIQIAQDSYAIDEDINIIFQEAINDFAVPSDSNWYWVRVSHQESNIETGTVNLSANGNITGTNTKFTEVLRDQNNYPVKINFPDSTQNTGDYQVVSVLSDTQAVLSGNFVDENNLEYRVIGSFTPGQSPSGDNRLIYIYDDCNLELVEEATPNTPPAKTDGGQFYIARVQNVGDPSVTIQDKRAEIFSASGEIVNDWVQPTLNSGFNNVANREVEYRKDYLGYVEIRGAFNAGSGTLFTLPEEFRPSYTVQGIYGQLSGDATLKVIVVDTDGNVAPGTGSTNAYESTNNVFISLRYQIN